MKVQYIWALCLPVFAVEPTQQLLAMLTLLSAPRVVLVNYIVFFLEKWEDS